MNKKLHFFKVLLCFGIITCLLFLPDILRYISGVLNHQFFESTFIVKYDWNLQHIPFYQEFYRMIDAGEIAWSWNQLLGINFYASKAYYLLGDPYAWIGYVFYSLIGLSVSNCLFLITLLKITVSGILMYLYLQMFCRDRRIAFVFAVLFMSSGWVTTFIEQPVFLSFYSICPLLLYGTEKVLREDKYVPVIISSALLLFINYYLSWMFCLFLLVYWLVRYWQIKGRIFSKEFLVVSVKMLGSFLVGVLISAVVWYPSLKHMILNSRLVSGDHVTYFLWEPYDFFAILKNFFVPVFKFNDTVYRSIWYYFYQIGIYCGCIQILLVPQFLFSKNIDRKTKLGFGALLAIFLITLATPQFGKLFHFTYSLRYTMLLMLLLLLIGTISLDQLEDVNRKVLFISWSSALLIYGVIGFVFPALIGKSDSIEVRLNLIVLCFFFLYLILLALNEIALKKGIICLVMLSEALCMGIIPIQSQREEISNVKYLSDYLIYQEAYAKLKEIDPDFSRVYIDGKVFNEGAYYNIPTTSSYDSCYQYPLHDFLSYMREYPDVDWAFSISGEEIFELLDVNYIITEKAMGEMYYQYFCEKLDVDLNSNLEIYKTNREGVFLKSYQSFAKKSEVDRVAYEDQYYLHEMSELLCTSMVVSDEFFEEYKAKYQFSNSIKTNPIVIENNHLEFSINTQNDVVVLLSMAFDPGWTASSDNQLYEIFSAQGGMCAIELPAGNYTLSLDYSVPGMNTGMILSGIGLVLAVFCFFMNKR
ncbi:MAG: YfhO family protein [Erysipelotrichaceae bacterium]|nr:YfhO family protein [Erysipelotrichaceae bacterium]